MRISRVCSILGFSRQAYYSRRKLNCSTVHPELMAIILMRRKDLPFEGIRKLYKYLRKKTDHHISRGRLEALLISLELIISRPKRYRVLTNSKHSQGFSANYLKDRIPVRNFEVLVSDYTYLKTRQREYYLIAIMDLYSRKLLSYVLCKNLGTDGLLQAFKIVVNRYGQLIIGSIFHSDRGSQFCSIAFKNLAEHYEIILSNSKSGNPYDNACMERLFSTLKNEYKLNLVFPDEISLKAALRDAVFSYNYKRQHMSLNFNTPQEKFMAASESY